MEDEIQKFYLKVGERRTISIDNKVERQDVYTSLEDESNTLIYLKQGSKENKLFNRTYYVVEFDESYYVLRKIDYFNTEVGLSNEMIRGIKRYKHILNEYSFDDYQKEQYIKDEFTRKRVK